MTQHRSLIAALPLVMLGGCTMLSSRPIADGQSALVHYYMPRTLFTVAVVQAGQPDNGGGGTTPPAVAPGVVTAPPVGSVVAPPAVATAPNAHAAQAPGDLLSQLTHKGAKTAKPTHAAIAAPPPPAVAAAPAAPRGPKSEETKPTYDLYITAKEVADPDEGHALAYRASIFSTDNFDVSVDDQGLLQGLNAKPSDQSVEFVRKLGDLGVATVKAVAAFGAVIHQQASAPKVLFSADIDPAQAIPGALPAEGSALASLAKFGYRIEFVHRAAPQRRAEPSADPCTEGLCFRSRQPVEMRVFQQKGADYQLVDDEVVAIANFSPIFVEPISRSFGVERDTLLTISNGYLTKVAVSKPAEAIAPVDALIDLANDVAGIPASIIGVRQTKYSNQKQLIDAQTNLITSQASLIDAQAALAAKKQPTPTPVSPPPQ